MTATAGRDHPDMPPAGTPREIRRVLMPEEVGEFDREWRAALGRAAEALDLGEVYRTLERWRRIALLTQADPDAHRRMLRAAARIRAGEPVPTVPLETVEALIRDQLAQ